MWLVNGIDRRHCQTKSGRSLARLCSTVCLWETFQSVNGHTSNYSDMLLHSYLQNVLVTESHVNAPRNLAGDGAVSVFHVLRSNGFSFARCCHLVVTARYFYKTLTRATVRTDATVLQRHLLRYKYFFTGCSTIIFKAMSS